jgi:glutathione peroxidase-family protein
VNGGNADPLYRFLKETAPNGLGLKNLPIAWNFGKFLCVDGVPTKRFEPPQNPLSFESDIRKGLGLE